jgi:hypothetical protein
MTSSIVVKAVDSANPILCAFNPKQVADRGLGLHETQVDLALVGEGTAGWRRDRSNIEGIANFYYTFQFCCVQLHDL